MALLALFKNSLEVRIAGQNRLLQLFYVVVALLQIVSLRHIAKAISVALDLRNPTIAIFKIVQSNYIIVPLRFNVILDSDIIVKSLVGPPQKLSLPFYIKVTSLAIGCTASHCRHYW